MTIMESLQNDHSLITRLLDNMYLSHGFLIKDEQVPASVFHKSVEFAKGFMNTYHHYREEYILFLKLAEKKGGSIDAKIVALRDQHERGRNLVTQIKKSLEKYEAGAKEASNQLAAATGAYVTLMRQHIHSENHEFYPLAEKELSSEELGALESEFKKFEQKQGEQDYQKATKLVSDIEADLKEKFGAVYRDQYELLVKDRGHEH